MEITYVIYNLQTKIEKATQNDKILLVNYWTQIMFRTESKRVNLKIYRKNECFSLLVSSKIAQIS